MVVTLSVDDFGMVEDHISKEQKPVKRFTWTNAKSNVSVQVSSFRFTIEKSHFSLVSSSSSDHLVRCDDPLGEASF
jgi:hypothetical protein